MANAITNGAFVQAVNIGQVSARLVNQQANITASGSLSTFQAGTVSNATFIVGSTVGKFQVNRIDGLGYGTYVSIGGHVGELWADTITGGLNGNLSLSVVGGIDKFTVGLLEGGQAQAGGYASTSIAVVGPIGSFQAGLITGGSGTGDGSYATLNLNVSDLSAAALGNVGSLNASAMIGGQSSDGGYADMSFTISHDLTNARLGQLVGSALRHEVHQGNPSVYLTVGHDIVKMVVGEIDAGTANGVYAFSGVLVNAGNDIRSFTAGTINGGSADGTQAETHVGITAGHDIHSFIAQVIQGGSAMGDAATAGVYVNAGRNIDFIAAGYITGTESHHFICDPTVQFNAGGDIGCVLAGQITGGTVNSDGVSTAIGSVQFLANGTYVDENGLQSAGDVHEFYAGLIRGGDATGEGAVAFVKIYAANDIDALAPTASAAGPAVTAATPT